MSGIGENGWGGATRGGGNGVLDQRLQDKDAEIARLKAGAVSFGYGSVGEMALIIKSQRAENAELRRAAEAAKKEYDRTIATARDTVARFARSNAEMKEAMAKTASYAISFEAKNAALRKRLEELEPMASVYQHDDEADRRQTQNEIGKLSVMGAAILALAVMLFAWKLGWVG